MKPSIKRLFSDLVEIKIGKKVYHVISDDTPILSVNKFVDGKSTQMNAEEKNHVLLHFHRFKAKKEE